MTSVEEQPSSLEAAPGPGSSDQPRRQSGLQYWPLWQIASSRVKEFYRHPAAIFWVYVFPILMAIVLGIAFENPQVEKNVVDVQQGPGAEAIVDALNRPTTDYKRSNCQAAVFDEAQARFRLRTGRTDLILIAKPAAENESRSAVDPIQGFDLEYLFDPTRPESVVARRTIDDRLQRAAGRRDPLAVEDRQFIEPGGRYIDFLVPGLIGASLMSGALWGVGFVVVDLRVRHLLKRFVTTPMKKSDFLAGLMLSRFFFMITEVILMLVCTWLLFDVRILGSWLALAVFTLLGSWTFASIGLVVASRAQSLETASGIINLVILPMWLVSGIFFAADRFPAAMQPLIKILPLAALINAMRAIMLEGAGFAATLFPLVVLLVWSVICFAAALKLFRWY